jgi:hypothetical protein
VGKRKNKIKKNKIKKFVGKKKKKLTRGDFGRAGPERYSK